MAKRVGGKRTRKRARLVGDPPTGLIDRVRSTLSEFSPAPPREIGNCMNLRNDLRLTTPVKQTLATPFEKIARDFDAAASVSDAECGKLVRVEDAFALVAKKAGFTFKKECVA